MSTTFNGKIVTAKNKPLQKLFTQKSTTFTPVSYDADNHITYYSRNAVLKMTMRSLEHGEPVFIAGVPGISKSVSISQIAKVRANNMGRIYKHWGDFTLEEREKLIHPEAKEERAKYYIMMDVRTNLMAKEDATGIPDVMNTLKYTKYRPQLWLYFATLENSAGMVFFDEMNQGADEVLKSLMQTFLDKRIGDHQFNNRNGWWDITAAGNVGTEYNNTEIPIALRQRAAIYGMSMTSREWTTYAKSIGIDDAIISFVNSGYKKTADGGEVNTYLVSAPETELDGGVSPRSIEKFNNQYVSMIQNDVSELEVKSTAAGLLTQTWANDFILYLRNANLFDFEKFQIDSDLYFNNIEKYIEKYDITTTKKNQNSTKSAAAAHELVQRYFTSHGKKQIALMFTLMKELFESLIELFIDYNTNDKITIEQRNAIKIFVEFLQLMYESDNEEINAILINMFLTDNEDICLAKMHDIILHILTILKNDISFQSYFPVFKKLFNKGFKLSSNK